VLREVLAEAIERMSDTDDRLLLLTVTGVTSDPDFRHATVLFASLSDDAKAALTEVRLRLQALIASQVRLKRTPQLAFAIDPAVSTGQRVEEILRHIRDSDAPPGQQGVQDEQ
jgi:ribosome-binding factor A